LLKPLLDWPFPFRGGISLREGFSFFEEIPMKLER